MEKMISVKYLQDHPNEVFVFGDNTIRRGKKIIKNGLGDLRKYANVEYLYDK